ncbi:FAD binding domain-containing protein [Seiridium cupressi]
MAESSRNFSTALPGSVWEFAAASECALWLSKLSLGHFLEGKVVSPGQPEFEASRTSYWSAQEQEIAPSCIAIPTSKEDVSVAVTLLNLGGQVFPEECKFAIRSGGHSPYAGSANIALGIILDLQNRSQLEVSTEKSTVEIEPGNRWVNVYSALEQQGLATVGGRVATVGVSGLVTGGGISFFSGRYGYACDNVQNFGVVLATGEIVNANATTNSDLWRALKGGSNNFGVVTSFTLPVFEQGNIWGGQLGIDISAIDDVFLAFESFTGNPDFDSYAALISSVGWIASSNTWMTAHSLEYTKAVDNPPIFDGITSLGPQFFSTLKISSLSNITTDMGASIVASRRQLFASATYKNSAAMMSAIYEIAQEIAQNLVSVSSLIWVFSFQPIPSIINAKAAAYGGNSLGLEESDGNLFNILLSPTWDTAEDDGLVYAQARELFRRMEAKAKELDVYHAYIYLNYADSWQDPIAGYGS